MTKLSKPIYMFAFALIMSLGMLGGLSPALAVDDALADGNQLQVGAVRAAEAPSVKAAAADVASGKCGGNITWTIDSNYKLTISGRGAMYDYEYDTTPWYSYKDQIKSISISSGITYIGNYAFYYMRNLTSDVTIPNSVTRLGDYAFFCYSRSRITLSNNLTRIGVKCFASSDLTSITLPSSLQYIDEYAFQKSDLSGSLTIPYGVEIIWAYAFSECKDLKAVTIPGSVTQIEECAFYWCSALTTLNLAEGLNSLGAKAFEMCASLKSVTLPYSLGYVGESAFESCGLTSANLSSANLGESAFWGCRFLKTVTNAGANVGKCAFEGCKALESITFEVDEYDPIFASQEIEESAFEGCVSLSSVVIPANVGIVGKRAFYNCSALSSVTFEIAGGGVTQIGESAFEDCTSLASVMMPATIQSLEKKAFAGCTNLRDMYFPNTVMGTICEFGENCFMSDQLTIHYPAWAKSWERADVQDSGGDIRFAPSEALYEGSCGAGVSWAVDDVGELIISGNGPMDDYDADLDQPWSELRNLISSVVVEEGVTAIGRSAFKNCPTVVARISGSVSKIGDSAFEQSPLRNATVKRGVKTVGASAFARCPYLGNVTLEEGVSELGEGAFESCKTLWTVHLPESLRKIGSRAFYGCLRLWGFSEMPNGVLEIGDQAFAGCASLSDFSIPNHVEKIGARAFEGCSKIHDLQIPGCLTALGDEAFSGCSGLTSAAFLGSAPKIGDNCFKGTTLIAYYSSLDASWTAEVMLQYGGSITWEPNKLSVSGTCGDNLIWSLDHLGNLVIAGSGPMYDFCYSISEDNPDGIIIPWTDYASSIQTVTLPDGLTRVGSSAFSDFTKLEAIELPDTVTSIGADAFSGCSITEIKLPDSLTQLEGGDFFDGIFWGCSRLELVDLSDQITEIPGYTFYGCELLESIDIPPSVTKIGPSAFWGCSALQEITIPDNVTDLGEGAFGYCVSLRRAVLGNGITVLQNEVFADCSSLEEIVIPDTVTEIGSYAIAGSRKLTSIKLPNGVNRIGPYAFASDIALEQVNIPQGVKEIPRSAFGGCRSLKAIELPDGLASIGEQAFYGCSSLETIRIWDSIRTLGPKCFGGCDGLWSITYTGDVPSIASDSFEGVTATALYFIDNPTWTDDVQLDYGGDIGYVGMSTSDIIAYGKTWTLYADGRLLVGNTEAIPDADPDAGVGEPWSHHASQITSLEILDGVERIGDNAFAGCTSLETVTIADSVTSIGDEAFQGCTALAEVTLSEGLESIGDEAFQGCGSLAEVTLPDGLASIGAGAFADCPLSEVAVPESVTAMGAGCIDSAVKISCVAGSAAAEYAAANGNPAQVHAHVWGAPTWAWASDDVATATFTCQEDAAHVKKVSASVSQTIMKEATYLEEGTKLCVAVVSLDGQTYSDVRTVAIPRLEGLANAVTGTASYARTYSTQAQTFRLDAKARGGKLTYASGDAANVSVDAAGNVTIRAKAPAGAYAVTVTASDATGKYETASMRVSVTVNPSATKVASAKSKAGGKVVVKWKRNPSATGYEIQCSASKKFKSGVKTLTAKRSAKKATLKKLRKGRAYYVRIRTVAKAGGKTYYSAWSAKKKVKVTR